ncbi:hypothetical protein [Chromohalobacter israelensis]|uniref:hypothetical protein n=1 Tax=Chromohalobacter israelensis TaxID=141390 RepID=UPI00211B5829|nr:hypothetical protein [Chromohalobacter salexigens]
MHLATELRVHEMRHTSLIVNEGRHLRLVVYAVQEGDPQAETFALWVAGEGEE